MYALLLNPLLSQVLMQAVALPSLQCVRTSCNHTDLRMVGAGSSAEALQSNGRTAVALLAV
jgi:hypothetical protein